MPVHFLFFRKSCPWKQPLLLEKPVLTAEISMETIQGLPAFYLSTDNAWHVKPPAGP